MAKQIGLIKIKGTVHDVCFYFMDGKFYARRKSKLPGERVKNDPAFSETMRYAKQMGNASKIASAIYRQIVPASERSRDKYREVVGMVIRELKKSASAVSREEGKHRDSKTGRYTRTAFIECKESKLQGSATDSTKQMHDAICLTRRDREGAACLQVTPIIQRYLSLQATGILYQFLLL